jgi:uncharacterized damage-inducible protein DinB
VSEKELLARFWKKEGKTTRNVIARIPEGSTYTPDPKSRPAREIAWQIVHEERSLIDGLEKGRLEWTDPPVPATVKDVLAAYDEHLATFADRFQAVDEARLEGPVPFVFGGKELNSSTGFANAWGFLFDIVHHRGQITTYLRAMGSTVPQIYGPTADEP